MKRWEALSQIVMARLREFTREPAAVFWVYGFPLIMIVTLGMAFRSQPIEKIRVGVLPGESTESVLAALNDSGRFDAFEVSEQQAPVELRTGRIELVIVPRGPAILSQPAALSSDFSLWDYVANAESDSSEQDPSNEQGSSIEPRSLEFRFDDTRPGSVLARDAANDVLQRAAGRVDLLLTSQTIVEEPGSRYVDFLVPGLIGMSLMGGGMWGVGYAIVDMRIRKLLKRFVATPMRRSDFLIGMMVSRLLFLLPEFVLLLVFARLSFGVTSAGGYTSVAILILLGSVQFSGLGLLVASRASTIETISGLMNLVMLPMWIFGGIFFSNERFPAFLQPLISALPITPLIQSLRMVMLEGVGLMQLGPQLGIMLAWSIVTFSIALFSFRWN